MEFRTLIATIGAPTIAIAARTTTISAPTATIRTPITAISTWLATEWIQVTPICARIVRPGALIARANRGQRLPPIEPMMRHEPLVAAAVAPEFFARH